MAVKMVTHTRIDQSTFQKFNFLDNLRDSLHMNSAYDKYGACPVLKCTSYKHHAEIHDIVIHENKREKSLLRLFEQFSVLVIPEGAKLKLFLSPKNKSINGYNKSEGFLAEFKKFLNDILVFNQGDYDEIIFFD